jgi:hypothetical protein
VVAFGPPVLEEPGTDESRGYEALQAHKSEAASIHRS